MKIVIAPDSYKESLSALEVATAIERGFREIFPEAVYVKLPVADGGEGTVEAMIAATQGRIVHVPVTGPLGERVEGFYGLSGDEQSAFIEMAAASGLELVVPSQRNPLKPPRGARANLFVTRWMRALSISSSASAAAPPMTAEQGWCRRWGQSCWTTANSPLGRAEASWENSRVST